MADFTDRVVTQIRRIPAGKVATYGQIAGLAGSPRSAIIVGQILRHQTHTADLPWQRVINRDGRISIINMEFPASLQADLLRAEGVEIVQKDNAYFIDLNRFQWQAERA